jgi:hypothetical protein
VGGGFLWPICFWQYPSGQTSNLINNHWLVCNTLKAYVKTLLILSLVLLCFVSLGTNVLHGVAKEGMTWEKDGHRFIYKFENCN